MLYIEGCFAYYLTQGEEAKSHYCFMLVPEEGRPPEEWEFKHCPLGEGPS